jgi:nucleotidyltransferase/DNA polymerase involved in DNA repair
MSDETLQVSDIEGVSARHAALLHRVGVDTVPDLAAANATRLRRRLALANAALGMTDALPSESMVVRWVARARGLDLALVH